MFSEMALGLTEGNPYEIETERGPLKIELRQPYYSETFSLLTSESGNPIGYMDFFPSELGNLDHAQVFSDRGRLGREGFILDDRGSYYPDFDEVNGGFVGHSPSWGFFINEKYRGLGIGRLMFSSALELAKQLRTRGFNGNEAFFMIHKMMSGFFSKYFRDKSGSIRKGVEYCEEYSGHSSALVFPDFTIPSVSGMKGYKKLEHDPRIYGRRFIG